MKTRIEQLRQKIRKATGQDHVFGARLECSPKVEEAFVEKALTGKTSANCSLFDVLLELGVELPRPKKLTNRGLSAKLWEVIRALLGRSIVLCNTDHLSDRELYTLLWNETLRGEFILSQESALHIDLTKTGIDEGMPTYLKYYASETQRQMYADVYPDFKMPEHVEPPYRRDYLIPDVSLQVKKRVN